MRIEHWIYSLPLRLRSLFRKRGVEQDLDDELQYHLDQEAAQLTANGMTADEARRAALRSMQGLTQRKEECRETWGVAVIENTVRDVRFGLRVLAKSRGFTSVAIATLALAIGANAVVFALLNGLILRPLNLPQPESLWGLEHGSEHSMYESYPDFQDLRDRNRSFDGIAGATIDQVGLDTGGNPVRCWIWSVTSNYFDALRLKPELGRYFHQADEHGANSMPYIVLSDAYWRNHFSADPTVIGRVVRVNRHPFTIIGVTPKGFHGTLAFGMTDFYAPIVDQAQFEGKYTLEARDTQTIFMTFGHLKDGVTIAQAKADLDSVGAYIAKTYPTKHGSTTFVLARPGLYGNYLGGPMRAFMTGLMALSGLILLAACANLGGLFAARAADRAREIALRLALGAARGRILRQLLTETILIAIGGGALGLGGSVLLLRQLVGWQPFPRFPMDVPVSVDSTVYAFSLGLALLSGLLFGIVPVRQAFRADAYQVVKSGLNSAIGRRINLRELLLAAQIAICALLVTASLVAVRGMTHALEANFGFEPRNAIVANTDLAMAGYSVDEAQSLQKRMIQAIAGIPGVESVGLEGRLPLAGGGFSTTVFSDETADFRPEKAIANPFRYNISPEYLHAANTALLSGRPFTWHDDKGSPAVAIMNRQLAVKAFGSVERALGAWFKLRTGTRVQVVGVVEDGKYLSLTEDPMPALFLPILQAPMSETWLIARSPADPRRLAAAIRKAVWSIDSGLPVYIEPWTQQLDLAMFPARIAAIALGVLGIMGGILSITGIFGMAAYSVSKRLREIGIRMALGAQRQEVLGTALGRALKLLAAGSAVGLLLGILGARVMASIVYQATPRDPLVLGGVAVVMTLLGVFATWIPAQRALSADPVTLLREE